MPLLKVDVIGASFLRLLLPKAEPMCEDQLDGDWGHLGFHCRELGPQVLSILPWGSRTDGKLYLPLPATNPPAPHLLYIRVICFSARMSAPQGKVLLV